MGTTKMQADLYCGNCETNTLHEVAYLGDKIEKIKCMDCEAYLEINEKLAYSNYAAEMFARIATKPVRMTTEINDDLSRFLYTIPFRVVTKPYRMIKEFKQFKEL
ncbi:hypothetical protein [Anaerosolibacter sp.]|uniref:hypothetical protein n=1 Tax=Anaerosolibacter sp. TaxID=1872527 RepID=UPI0039F10CF7